MNEFPYFGALVGFFGLIRAFGLLSKESFSDSQSSILSAVQPRYLRLGFGALCAFFAFRMYTYNAYSFSKSDIFFISLLFWGNVFWASVFLIPPKDSKLALKIKSLYNPNLQIVGILLTMYNGRLTLTGQVVAELKKYYADKLFKVPISRTVRISEAPGYGEPICYHDPYGKGSLEYAAVAKELMLRI